MTDEQAARLRKCQTTLGEFVDDRYYILSDWLNEIGQAASDEVRTDIIRFIPAISIWLSEQPLDRQQIGRLMLDLSLLIGEVLAQRFEGCWLLADRVESPHFANYIVSKFRKASNPKTVVNPFMVAATFLNDLESTEVARRPTLFDVLAAERAKLSDGANTP